MLQIRRSNDRGRADFGWLDSRHTFSFGQYRDPAFMGFGHLRVINDDRVIAGRGFPLHPHRNMEIISYVVAGELAHEDSEGHSGVVRAGEVQLMSAGRGIRHSEMNGSQTHPLHFLQIWVNPARTETAPRYEQLDFGVEPGLALIASPDGRDHSLQIGRDLDLHRLLGTGPSEHRLALRRPRAWVQVVHGTLTLRGETLHAGDGVALTHPSDASGHLDLSCAGPVDALIFDLL